MDMADDFDFIFEGEADILRMTCYGSRAIGATIAVKIGYRVAMSEQFSWIHPAVDPAAPAPLSRVLYYSRH
jgi:hypothetical protein